MRTERCLIINADGYGFTPGVNEGIVQTFESGIVNSTSCVPNFGHLSQASVVQGQFPQVSFGIHFNLNVGFPCAPADRVRSLVGEDGRFFGSNLGKKLVQGKIIVSEIERELTEQAAMLADQNIKISHWDGHQNKHLWPVYFEVASRVAKRFGIFGVRSHRRQLWTNAGALSTPALLGYYLRNPKRAVTHVGGRLRSAQANHKGFAVADRLITPGYADNSHKSLGSFWDKLADTLSHGYSEVYCHPGIPDQLLRDNSRYVEQRANEVEVLTRPELRERFEAAGVTMANFWDLKRARGL